MRRSARAYRSQQATLHCNHDRVGPVPGSQAVKDSFEVCFDRVGREEEPVGDLAVGEPSAHTLENFELPLGQGWLRSPGVSAAQAPADRLGNLSVQVNASAGHHPERLKELLSPGGLDQVALSSQLQRLDDALLVVVNAEDKHAHGTWQFARHELQKLQSVIFGQIQIQQHQIDFHTAQVVPGGFQPRCAANVHELRGLGQNSPQSIAHQLMVVNDV